ncbi:MAG: protein hupE [Phenylobacterium sp.]|nr:protein hupE [Phenylobacterium sp.]
MGPIEHRRLLAGAALGLGLAAAAPALAHPGHPGHEILGFWAGLAHPFSGADHILAMTAVGLCAALRGGRALAAWPAAFVAAMAAGFALNGLSPGLTEAGVLASVMLLGLFAAAKARGPGPAALALVAAAGALHGMAHAGDVGAAGPRFALGMLSATALLQLAGLALGVRLRRIGRADLVRLIGVGVAAAGGLMAATAG